MEKDFIQHKAEKRKIPDQQFDIAIIGGGISGASLYHHCCSKGYRTILLEKGDFANGTSQSSSMMIWGGLLYLKNKEFLTVKRLCVDRNKMIRECKDKVRPTNFRYIPGKGGTSTTLIQAALYAYWVLGKGKTAFPRKEKEFPEKKFLNQVPFSLRYAEACVTPSDARFVLESILSHQSREHLPLNYAELRQGQYNQEEKVWKITFFDHLEKREKKVQSKWFINAAGVWVDDINKKLGLQTPFKHLFSKGVFIGTKRYAHHHSPLIMETKMNGGDFLSYIPWGPIALWGPTERWCETPAEGFITHKEEVTFLLEELNKHLKEPLMASDIISLRVGVRSLAVKKKDTQKPGNPVELSRQMYTHFNEHNHSICIYGGKFTNYISLAESVLKKLLTHLPTPSRDSSPVQKTVPEPLLTSFPGLPEKIPSAQWCFEQELCWHLEDYLRRRTNISQWVPRGGLGRNNEYVPQLLDLAAIFVGPEKARSEVQKYRQKIEKNVDNLLKGTEVTL